MHVMDRPGWFSVAVAAIAGVLFAALGAAASDLLNGPGHRVVAGPVLWAVGGGIGLALGAVLAALSTRLARWVFAAVLVGALPVLVLVVVAYNDKSLGLHDQVVGSAVVVVGPGAFGALLVGLAVLSGTVFRSGLGERRRARNVPPQSSSAIRRASFSG